MEQNQNAKMLKSWKDQDDQGQFTAVKFDDGIIIRVFDCTVGDGGHPSNRDYYDSERGYNCGGDDVKVAISYHTGKVWQ